MEVMSAAPYLALLNESDDEMKAHALVALNSVVHLFWAEIANSVSQMEDLYETELFADRALAALVISKVYYNLGDFEASVKYALYADDRFDVTEKSQYVETIVSHCIDQYINLSSKHFVDQCLAIDPRLTSVFERMIQKCFATGSYEPAIGISLESYRLDIVESTLKEMIEKGDETHASRLITYCLECINSVAVVSDFKSKVLASLVQLLLLTEDYKDCYTIFKALVQLNDVELAYTSFKELIKHDMPLLAYQGAFDLVSAASQGFSDAIVAKLNASEPQLPEYRKIVTILLGVPSCDLDLTFLCNNNNTDISILNKTKNLLDAKSSIYHSAVTFANAFMHAGTTDDSFFRKNLDWLGRASNWLKFSATAALGVIHKGNLSQGRNILKPYLPGTLGLSHSKGGSLFALGLVYSGHGSEIIGYLQDYINTHGNSAGSADSEVALHGAALGAGVAAMASNSNDLYEALKVVLYSDSAVLGQAAGLAMGLVMMGSGNKDVARDMLTYAQETCHENIVRGLLTGLALLHYGKGNAADSVIESLMEKENHILRYGGAFTIALAYAGTGDDGAIKKLLHFAVSDPSDDVRRASVLSLGFLLIRDYESAPQIVKLLSHSHNPHVRYGTCMALGIACAGRGLDEAIAVLEPLTKDPVDFVRQGAMMAISMILVEQLEMQYPKLKEFHELFANSVKNKHEDALAKFGATLSQGIINAGGRNVTIQLENPYTNTLNIKAVAGLAVFVQSWFWFPFAHFLSLSFAPTATIGITGDFKIPKLEMQCYSSPELFQYPLKVEELKEKTPDKLVKAVLSTTARAKTREKKKQLANSDQMDIDNEAAKTSAKSESKPDAKAETKGEVKDDPLSAIDKGPSSDPKAESSENDTKTSPPRVEPHYVKTPFTIENMTRVLPSQAPFVAYKKESRFVPVRKFRGVMGVVILEDTRAGEKFETIKTVRQLNTLDAPVPEPFILLGDDLLDDHN